MVMIKRVLALLGSGALAILLLRQAETAAQAVRDGIHLCLTSVIPALFPFFAVSSLLVALGQRRRRAGCWPTPSGGCSAAAVRGVPPCCWGWWAAILWGADGGGAGAPGRAVPCRGRGC